jgi:hypothetical protein
MSTQCFIILKKTQDVRVVTDHRILNSQLVCRPFPIPRIKDILTEIQGFQYATAIDLSMGYYSIPLMEHAQQLTSFCYLGANTDTSDFLWELKLPLISSKRL